MAIEPVPDFFQEETDEALRRQIRWLQESLGINQDFLTRFLHMDGKAIHAWISADAPIAAASKDQLRDLWQTVLHVLSYVNFDPKKARQMLEHQAPEAEKMEIGENAAKAPFLPPWSGYSIKNHVANTGQNGLRDVDRWLSAMRFGNPYVV
jgi:hypothetical protein